MYFTDRGLDELADRRGEDEVTLGWLAEKLRQFVDLYPDAEQHVDRLASWLARQDDLDDLDYPGGVLGAGPDDGPGAGPGGEE